ncbi:MAG TPA: hypothetical protein VF789_12890 [Thermoanaerobaculia bacterium]
MRSEGLPFIGLDRPSIDHARAIRETADAILSTKSLGPPRLIITPWRSSLSVSRVAAEIRSRLGLGIVDSYSILTLAAIASLQSSIEPLAYFDYIKNLTEALPFDLSHDGSVYVSGLSQVAEEPTQVLEDVVRRFCSDPKVLSIACDVTVRLAAHYGLTACIGCLGDFDTLKVTEVLPGDRSSNLLADDGIDLEEIATYSDLSEADNLNIFIEAIRLRTA